MWDATVKAAQDRLDRTLTILRNENLAAAASSATTDRCAPWRTR